MKVHELVNFLQELPQDLDVVYEIWSEQCILERDDISIKELCHPRPDGWVQDARPDKPLIKYVVFPGN